MVHAIAKIPVVNFLSIQPAIGGIFPAQPDVAEALSR
jgi:hypothetical protein